MNYQKYNQKYNQKYKKYKKKYMELANKTIILGKNLDDLINKTFYLRNKEKNLIFITSNSNEVMSPKNNDLLITKIMSSEKIIQKCVLFTVKCVGNNYFLVSPENIYLKIVAKGVFSRELYFGDEKTFPHKTYTYFSLKQGNDNTFMIVDKSEYLSLNKTKLKLSKSETIPTSDNFFWEAIIQSDFTEIITKTFYVSYIYSKNEYLIMSKKNIIDTSYDDTNEIEIVDIKTESDMFPVLFKQKDNVLVPFNNDKLCLIFNKKENKIQFSNTHNNCIELVMNSIDQCKFNIHDENLYLFYDDKYKKLSSTNVYSTEIHSVDTLWRLIEFQPFYLRNISSENYVFEVNNNLMGKVLDEKDKTYTPLSFTIYDGFLCASNNINMRLSFMEDNTFLSLTNKREINMHFITLKKILQEEKFYLWDKHFYCQIEDNKSNIFRLEIENFKKSDKLIWEKVFSTTTPINVVKDEKKEKVPGDVPKDDDSPVKNPNPPDAQEKVQEERNKSQNKDDGEEEGYNQDDYYDNGVSSEDLNPTNEQETVPEETNKPPNKDDEDEDNQEDHYSDVSPTVSSEDLNPTNEQGDKEHRVINGHTEEEEEEEESKKQSDDAPNGINTLSSSDISAQVQEEEQKKKEPDKDEHGDEQLQEEGSKKLKDAKNDEASDATITQPSLDVSSQGKEEEEEESKKQSDDAPNGINTPSSSDVSSQVQEEKQKKKEPDEDEHGDEKLQEEGSKKVKDAKNDEASEATNTQPSLDVSSQGKEEGKNNEQEIDVDHTAQQKEDTFFLKSIETDTFIYNFSNPTKHPSNNNILGCSRKHSLLKDYAHFAIPFIVDENNVLIPSESKELHIYLDKNTKLKFTNSEFNDAADDKIKLIKNINNYNLTDKSIDCFVDKENPLFIYGKEVEQDNKDIVNTGPYLWEKILPKDKIIPEDEKEVEKIETYMNNKKKTMIKQQKYKKIINTIETILKRILK